MSIEALLEYLAHSRDWETPPSLGIPHVPDGLALPDDLSEFYKKFGGAALKSSGEHVIDIVGPQGFVRANPVLVGEECIDDISFEWFIIAQARPQYVTIDLNANRFGRCYDSFWDRHGVAGDCPIIAASFTDFLRRLLEDVEEPFFWLKPEFSPIGDAYD